VNVCQSLPGHRFLHPDAGVLIICSEPKSFRSLCVSNINDRPRCRDLPDLSRGLPALGRFTSRCWRLCTFLVWTSWKGAEKQAYHRVQSSRFWPCLLALSWANLRASRLFGRSFAAWYRSIMNPCWQAVQSLHAVTGELPTWQHKNISTHFQHLQEWKPRMLFFPDFRRNYWVKTSAVIFDAKLLKAVVSRKIILRLIQSKENFTSNPANGHSHICSE